jgi:hypothetical protein
MGHVLQPSAFSLQPSAFSYSCIGTRLGLLHAGRLERERLPSKFPAFRVSYRVSTPAAAMPLVMSSFGQLQNYQELIRLLLGLLEESITVPLVATRDAL